MAGYALSIYRECNVRKLRSGTFLLLFLLCLGSASEAGPDADRDLIVVRVTGEAWVRAGVAEEWNQLLPEMRVRPTDSIRTGRRTSVMVRVPNGEQYTIPAETQVDGSDFREFDRTELLLRLAMEDMLSVPDRPGGDRPLPHTTVLHGERRDGEGTAADGGVTESDRIRLRMNGAHFLAEQKFVGSALLKTRETLRLYPVGGYRPGALLFTAETLEQLALYEEAARYYREVLGSDAPAAARKKAEERLAAIAGKLAD